MRLLERLFCAGVWLAWIGLLVGRRGARPEERPPAQGGSGDACRSLVPDRTVLPGW